MLRVEQPHRLVFTWQWRAAEFGDELTTVDISIREEAQGCVLSIQHGPFEAAALSLHEAGWRAAVGRLPAALAGSQLSGPQIAHNPRKRYHFLLGKDDYAKLTIDILTRLYPKHCPTC
ncbi:MAG: SRPBCC domain-containing protein, partial [Spirochaetes bacterium]|nr:SRPBCC domain-containing protein [Spirochaetota bacterium]